MERRRLGIFRLVRDSLAEFGRNDPLRLAGATAFFTTFALPAVLLIVLQISSLVLSEPESNQQVFDKLTIYVGSQTTDHLITVLEGFEKVADNPVALLAGFLFVIFVATTLFKVIKNSLNQIWDIKVVAKKSLALTFRMRLRELLIVFSAGVLFLFVLLMEAIQAMATEQFLDSSGLVNLILNSTISFILSVFVATVWFGLIFCFLPDGRLPIRVGFTGAFITSILFNFGKLLLKYALLNSNIDLVFGKSAAVVLLLLFVFYTALIFYYGASFTKVLSLIRKGGIKPLRHAAVHEMDSERKNFVK